MVKQQIKLYTKLTYGYGKIDDSFWHSYPHLWILNSTDQHTIGIELSRCNLDYYANRWDNYSKTAIICCQLLYLYSSDSRAIEENKPLCIVCKFSEISLSFGNEQKYFFSVICEILLLYYTYTSLQLGLQISRMPGLEYYIPSISGLWVLFILLRFGFFQITKAAKTQNVSTVQG